MKSGIYKILNTVTGKFYIGSAVDIVKRWREHSYFLNHSSHKNKHLQYAWDKYCSVSFKFEIIEFCEKDKLIEREQYWITFTNCCNREIGYNLNPTAGNMLGFKHSKETIEKLKARIYTEEMKANMSKRQMGKKFSEETKLKWSEQRKGRIVSEKIKAQVSVVHKGKITSEKTKALISIANRGRKISPEAIAKREASRKENRKLKNNGARISISNR